MKIHLINPNSTASMTEIAAAAARQSLHSGTELLVSTGNRAPASIEGHADAALAVPEMLQAILAAEDAGAMAHVIACFDDPGLHAAREIATMPVIGICQAALQTAANLSARFSVVTTLPRSVAIIEDLVHHYGMRHACVKVRSVEMAVLDLEKDRAATVAKLVAEIDRAIAEDAAEAIVLGCAGMADLCATLSAACGLPVIDGVVAATKMAEGYAALGYATSKRCSYAVPLPKTGGFAPSTSAYRPA